MKPIGEHAVVIGASMGGLLAARALADFYGQVTVLERDGFPVADIPRKGVPQGKYAHGLLARCRTVIEQFCRFADEVRRRAATAASLRANGSAPTVAQMRAR
jgi:2-polyprenyl-6-methoxyphenol hydroxylase-like FAD-dependent oxidoreductase